MIITDELKPYEAKILADSICEETNIRLTTVCVKFPRFILPEQNTHRVLSKNTASSRAIPVKKTIRLVKENPFFPEVFGKNQRGMVAEEVLEEEENNEATKAWQELLEASLKCAEKLEKLNTHKQYANRVLELFNWTTQIITSTEWENYFNLRVDNDAQPEIQKAAKSIKDIYENHKPERLVPGDWHLPLIGDKDYGELGTNYSLLKKLSSARCARISYLTHEGLRDIEKDLVLHDALLKNGHMSPFEHCAELGLIDGSIIKSFENKSFVYPYFNVENIPNYKYDNFIGNFRAPWIQYRKTIKGESVKNSAR